MKYDLRKCSDFLGTRFVAKKRGLRPPSIDLRSKLPSVFDQGQEGSCGPNSVDGLMCLLYPNVAGFSRQQIYYNVRQIEGTVNEDSGVMTVDLFKALQANGAAPESLWPYNPKDFKTAPPASVMAEAAKHKIASFTQLASEEDFMECLAEGFPFVLGIEVYDSLVGDELATNGIMTIPQTGNMLGGHDVLVVGYDTNFYQNPDFIKSGVSTADVQETALLIRNSWGEGWGLNGHFYMPISYGSNSKTGGDAWTARL